MGQAKPKREKSVSPRSADLRAVSLARALAGVGWGGGGARGDSEKGAIYSPLILSLTSSKSFALRYSVPSRSTSRALGLTCGVLPILRSASAVALVVRLVSSHSPPPVDALQQVFLSFPLSRRFGNVIVCGHSLKMDVDTKKTSISSRRHENLGDEGSYATSLGSVALAEERTSPW